MPYVKPEHSLSARQMAKRIAIQKQRPIRLNNRKQAGFNLVEVMIAALVISVGMLGIAGLQLISMKGSHQSYMRHQATYLLQDVVERIRANPAQLAAYDGFDSKTSTSFSCPPAKDCSANSCNGADLVNYDKSSVACGLNQRLNSGRIQVSCNPAGVCANNNINVRISWVERAFGKETVATDADGRSDSIVLNTDILPLNQN